MNAPQPIDDPLDDLLAGAEWPADRDATGRLAARWTDAFRDALRADRRRRPLFVGLAVVGAAVAAVVAVSLTLHRDPSDQPSPNRAIATNSDPRVDPPPPSTPFTAESRRVLVSRSATPVEFAIVSVGVSPSRPRAAVAAPATASPAPRPGASIDAVALLRAAAVQGRRQREAACVRLERDPSPSVSEQLAQLLSDDDLRRDALRILTRRTDAVAVSAVRWAEASPQTTALLRSVRAEEAFREVDAPSSPADPSIPPRAPLNHYQLEVIPCV